MIGNTPLNSGDSLDADPLLAMAAAKFDELLASPLGFAQLAQVAAARAETHRRNEGERYRHPSPN